jgi:hypothetical protein
MYNGKAAENELKSLAGGSYMENDLIRHNLVVFRGGENALQARGEEIGVCSTRGTTMHVHCIADYTLQERPQDSPDLLCGSFFSLPCILSLMTQL